MLANNCDNDAHLKRVLFRNLFSNNHRKLYCNHHGNHLDEHNAALYCVVNAVGDSHNN